MKKMFLPILLVALTFASCQKNLNQTPSNHSSKLSNEKGIPTEMLVDSSQFLTESQIDSIAILHNLYMTEAIQNFNYNTTNDSTELRSIFINIGLTDFQYSQSDLSNMLDSDGNQNSNLHYLTTYTSPSVVTMINYCKDYLYNDSTINYSAFSSFISQEISYAHNNFIGSDLDVALTFLKTFQKSVYLWMPTNEGGSGIGQGFINNLLNQSQPNSTNGFVTTAQVHERTVDWKAIAWADGVGAAGTLLRTWYLAGFGPLSWSAIIFAIGFGAAWASGGALLYQLM